MQFPILPWSETDVEPLHEKLAEIRDKDNALLRANLNQEYPSSEVYQGTIISLSIIDLQIEYLALIAQSGADLFWEEVYERARLKEYGHAGVRVKLRKGTLEIDIFRNRFQKARGTKAKPRMYAKRVARTGRHHYTAADVKFALPWEREILLALEENMMADIRKQFFHLAQARRSLKLADKPDPNYASKIARVKQHLEEGDPDTSWINEYR